MVEKSSIIECILQVSCNKVFFKKKEKREGERRDKKICIDVSVFANHSPDDHSYTG